MKLRIDDIIFWVLIALVLAVVIWKFFGSPTDLATLIAVAVFLTGSEIMLWRAFFENRSDTKIEFLKMKNNLDKVKMDIDFKLDKVGKSTNRIEAIINTSRRKNN